jgi:hypothetical protein
MAQSPETSDFYADALSEAERLRLPKARSVAGLEEEIALLRVRLFRAVQEHPEQLELLLKGVNVLVRLAALRYKLSDKPAQELAKSIEGVLRGVGGALYPERFINGG